jgi:Exo-beta-D-glucosaminidase Ig-fold domain
MLEDVYVTSSLPRNFVRPLFLCAMTSSNLCTAMQVKPAARYLTNSGATPALAAKLMLKDATTNECILPAYYNDSYTSIMSGEARTLSIAYPSSSVHGNLIAEMRGWNLDPVSIPVSH